MLSSFHVIAKEGNDPKSFQVSDIMHKEQSPIDWGSRVTVRVPNNFPLGYWITCNYYNEKSEVIASTNHVLRERVPTWSVKAKHNEISFALCKSK